MPRAAIGFDSDSHYHEALKAKVLADRDAAREAAILQEAHDREAERERRRSLGLPKEEEAKKKGWWRRSSQADDPKDALKRAKEQEEKTGLGEKTMNLIFNAGRSKKRDIM